MTVRGWTPWLWALLAIGAALAAALVWADTRADQALLAARYTARAAFACFVPVYLASPLVRLWPGERTRALARQRRQLGLAFAFAMAAHLLALAVNVLVFRPRAPETLIAGGTVYGLIVLMALTSSQSAQRLLGKAWKPLHRLGLHATWAVFFVSYGGKLAEPATRAASLVLFPVVLAIGAVRLAAWRKARR